jgi:hypothetical protein
MNPARMLLAAGAIALCLACRSLPEQREVPALVTDPTAESRAELQEAVSKALHGAPVTLADDALTTSSLLTIERQPHRDPQGRLLSGRDLGRPHQFRLIQSDSRCFLVREADGERWELAKASCAPE